MEAGGVAEDATGNRIGQGGGGGGRLPSPRKEIRK